MRIFIYGSEEDYNSCVSCLDDISQLQYRRIEYTHTNNYDEFIKKLADPTDKADLIIIVSNGAEGMETVMASKRVCPDAHVVWISDDSNFGIQSYRMGCTYFGVKPISEKMMADAIHNYNTERVG